MSESVRLEISVAAPVAAVWRMLTDPAELPRWFGWEYEGLAEEIEQIFRVGATVTEPGRVLDTNGGGRFELDFAGEHTRLRVVREGEPAPPSDPIDEGWRTFTEQLRFAVERHPGQERRTAYVSGTDRPGGGGLIAAAGLAGLRAGDSYRVTAATGEELTGVVWFATERQLGLAVDGYGDGLVILYDPPPASAAAVLVTTYGLDDATFAAIERRWRAWWSS